jgi:hypothetical protein
VAALDAGSSRQLTDLLAAADAALYRAKASGRDQVQMISTSRGLSAVRPGDDRDADAGGLWHRDTVLADTVLADTVLADTVLADTGPPGRGRQPEVDTDDSDSTATTSVLAV